MTVPVASTAGSSCTAGRTRPRPVLEPPSPTRPASPSRRCWRRPHRHPRFDGVADTRPRRGRRGSAGRHAHPAAGRRNPLEAVPRSFAPGFYLEGSATAARLGASVPPGTSDPPPAIPRGRACRRVWGHTVTSPAAVAGYCGRGARSPPSWRSRTTPTTPAGRTCWPKPPGQGIDRTGCCTTRGGNALPPRDRLDASAAPSNPTAGPTSRRAPGGGTPSPAVNRTAPASPSSIRKRRWGPNRRARTVIFFLPSRASGSAPADTRPVRPRPPPPATLARRRHPSRRTLPRARSLWAPSNRRSSSLPRPRLVHDESPSGRTGRSLGSRPWRFPRHGGHAHRVRLWDRTAGGGRGRCAPPRLGIRSRSGPRCSARRRERSRLRSRRVIEVTDGRRRHRAPVAHGAARSSDPGARRRPGLHRSGLAHLRLLPRTQSGWRRRSLFSNNAATDST